jgi:addiction module RelB/DinJ family antitoxin
MAQMTLRMDDQLNKELRETLESMGLNPTTYFVMAAKQLVAKQKIPFEIEATKPLYMTEAMEKLLIEEKAKMLGILPDDAIEVDEDYKKNMRALYHA